MSARPGANYATHSKEHVRYGYMGAIVVQTRDRYSAVQLRGTRASGGIRCTAGPAGPLVG